MGNKEQILVVDDSPTQRAIYALQLESFGYDVRFADDGPAGEMAYRQLMCPVVILDVMLPSAADTGFNGFHLSSVIRGINPEVITIIVTGLPDEPSTFARLLDSRADKILTQPTTIEEIISEIHYAQVKREALKPRVMRALSGQMGGSWFTNREMAVYAINLLFLIALTWFVGHIDSKVNQSSATSGLNSVYIQQLREQFAEFKGEHKKEILNVK